MGEKRIDELNDAQYPSYYHYLPIDRDVAAETAKLKADYFGRANDSSDIRCLGNANTTGAIIPSGKYFYKYDINHSNRKFAKAISNIAVNATLTENTNFKYVTIGEELDTLNAALLGLLKSESKASSKSVTYGTPDTIDISITIPTGYEILTFSFNSNTVSTEIVSSTYNTSTNTFSFYVKNIAGGTITCGVNLMVIYIKSGYVS